MLIQEQQEQLDLQDQQGLLPVSLHLVQVHKDAVVTGALGPVGATGTPGGTGPAGPTKFQEQLDHKEVQGPAGGPGSPGPPGPTINSEQHKLQAQQC